MGGTLDRCKERCSGDFNFVQNNAKEFKDLPGAPNAGSAAAAGRVAQSPGLQGRTWFSSVLMFDEIYDFLMELGVLDTPSSAARRQSSCGDVSGQTPNSGWANRLLRTGLSVHETKTCGSFGGLHSVCEHVFGWKFSSKRRCGNDARHSRGSWMPDKG